MDLIIKSGEDGKVKIETKDGQRLNGVKSVQVTLIEGRKPDVLIRLDAIEGIEVFTDAPKVDAPKGGDRDAVRAAFAKRDEVAVGE